VPCSNRLDPSAETGVGFFPMLRVLKSYAAKERIASALEFVRSLPPGTEIVIISASRDAVDDFVRAFAVPHQATFGLHRFSLVQFAARLAIVKLAAEGIAPGSAVGMEAVAVRSAYEAASQNQLKYFSPVTKFPGFGRATGATVVDLRSAGVAAERVRTIEESGPDNAALLESFEQQLTELLIADRTILFKIALEEVRNGADLSRHPLLFLDLPVHSAIEREFVSALAAVTKTGLFTCPSGDLPTLENLKDCGEVVDTGHTSPSEESSLARLGCYLFSETVPPEGKPNDEIVFFSAPGEERESVEIARRVLKEAERGVRFDQMSILLRAPDVYSNQMEAALRRAGIPAYFARGNRRPDPSGRALLAVLACAAEGLSALRFAEYLSFAQVPALARDGNPLDAKERFIPPEDDALGGVCVALAGVPPKDAMIVNEKLSDDDELPELDGSLRAPWRWEQLIVDAAVIGGRDRWVRRLDGLQKQFQAEAEVLASEDPDSPRVKALQRKLLNLGHLRAFALPVIAELAALPAVATWGEWINAVEHLAPRVLRKPERVLAVLADMKPMGPVTSVPLQEVRTVLQNWLTNLQHEPPESRYGRVLVARPEQVRGRLFDVVFVPGLAERMFPQKLREDPLLLDHLRKQLSSDLPVLRDRSQQERLLLQIAVGAAQKRLYLSYPRLEVSEARPRVPSFYALDIVRSITGRVPDYQVLARDAERQGDSRLAWPAPRDPLRAIDDAEYDLATVWPFLNTDIPREGRLAHIMKLNPNLARSLRSRWARWEDRWSRYDGLCDKRQSVVEILAAQRLNARPYSVSALQQFAVCPYRFLLSGIYRLESSEEPGPLEEMDPLTKGRLFHRIQAVLQRELKDKALVPVKAAQLPRALALLDEILARVTNEAYDELAPAIDRVWQDAIESMRSDLHVWLQKVAEQDGWIPIHFEFGFGFSANSDRDPASLADPVTLPSGAILHGVVDLIERSEDRKSLRITDHKTGKDITKDGLVVGKGEYLQPVLYGVAIETALRLPVTQGRFFYCTATGGFKETSVPVDQNARASAEIVLCTIDNSIAAPFLVPAPREKACDYCDFKEVCGPYEEIRIARKDSRRLEELKAMRGLA
jgi:ATP-dependent helicase/nuclease subunit B